jgi:shikimate kinase
MHKQQEGGGSVVLIGPPGVGKSTVAPLLGAALGLPVLDLDLVRWEYYAARGYDTAHAERLVRQQGLRALLAYWKPFELYAAEQALQDFPAHVIAFGAGHSFYEQPADLERARVALARAAAVVLLLPSLDAASAATILTARFPAGTPFAEVMWEVQREMLTHSSNRSLATMTVITEGQTPAEVCAAIVAELART